eukprot:GHVU01232790.1.p1 GENE.GHVU01232790.1~~GHVU01232790.1.p1  ORF type:complete len:405 (-),score=91.63 GHVU01232790.1:275-1489(-)
MPFLEQLGFFVAGLGCMTCIGNSGDLEEEVATTVEANKLVAASVLSGNRNFEGRVHPLTSANFLASPPLVVAFAIAGRVDIDFETEPLGTGKDGKEVFLKDIYPSNGEVDALAARTVTAGLYRDVYARITEGNARWRDLCVSEGTLYQWDAASTYIHNPPFFRDLPLQPPPRQSVCNARCLLLLGDSVTTDHISPAGKIAKDSPAARYLTDRGVPSHLFNSYGARRGNDEVMVRGTFANIRLSNKMAASVGPLAVHVPSGLQTSVFEVAELYRSDRTPLIIIAGKEYGSGSSRDWAAKGPKLLGVDAVIAESYERIHRSNLIGMGILPLEFLPGQSADYVGLNGAESFTIEVRDLKCGGQVTVTTDSGKTFTVKTRIDTEVELLYYNNDGILKYVLRKIAKCKA